MKRRVLILYGGRSSEHEISCLSARSVLASIDRGRYDVVPVGITREGRWVLTDGEIHVTHGGSLPQVEDEGPTVALVLGRKGPVLVRFPDDERYVIESEVDVAFPVLHGPYGEDGTVQGMLASVGVPYVGADVTASSLGVDKRAMKSAFQARDLPQVPYLAVRCERWQSDRAALLDELAGTLRYPMFTKPARQGSSIGISKTRDREGLAAGLEEAFQFDRVAIVEQGVEGARELEVGIIGNSELAVTQPGEVVPSHEFYDFDAKYLAASRLAVPAELPPGVADRVRELARQAYLAIGCRGMARVDLFYREPDALYINEINTIPGFTPSSMFPRLWQAHGLAYPDLIDRLIDLAFDAAHRESRYAP